MESRATKKFRKANNKPIWDFIEKVMNHLKQFKGIKWEEDWDGGSYYDNFVDGKGF